MHSVFSIILIILLCLPLVSDAGHPDVSVQVTPAFSNEPADIRVTIRIEPHPDNRYARLDWDSEDGQAGSQEWQLEPDARPTQDHVLRRVTGGVYGVAVRVFRVGGVVKQAQAGFEVVPRH